MSYKLWWIHKRNIFFFSPPVCGGAERVLLTIINNLDRSKFQITLVVVTSRLEAYHRCYRQFYRRYVEFLAVGRLVAVKGLENWDILYNRVGANIC